MWKNWTKSNVWHVVIPFLVLVALSPFIWINFFKPPAVQLEDGVSLGSMRELAPDMVGQNPGLAFKVRTDCHWMRPGRDPFTGSRSDALAALNVPEPTRTKILRRMEGKEFDYILTANRISFKAPAPDRTPFYSRFAMTFGMNVICYNTILDANGDYPGEVYVQDGYYIWVPYICGNISRIAPFFETQEYAKSKRLAPIPGVDRAGQPYRPLPPGVGDVEGVNVVPEPPIDALFFVGLFALVFGVRAVRYPKSRV